MISKFLQDDANLIGAGAPTVRTYPWIGRCNSDDGSFVVLFTEPATGTVVYSGNARVKLGHQSCTWLESAFVPLAPYEGVLLRN